MDFDLEHNNLSGSIPSELGDLTALVLADFGLKLNHNNLSGSIPPELGQLVDLRSIHLNNNNLSGSIPPELGQLVDLWYLDFSHNNLTGSLPPELASLNVHTFLLDGNALSGPIPLEYAQWENVVLRLDADTGLCLPENFPSVWESEFAYYAKGIGIPDCGAVVPALPLPLVFTLGAALLTAGLVRLRRTARSWR